MYFCGFIVTVEWKLCIVQYNDFIVSVKLFTWQICKSIITSVNGLYFVDSVVE